MAEGLPTELRLKSATMAQGAGIAVVLTLAAIAFHEVLHFLVYQLGSCPVRITLQSVRPISKIT
jgi:hypothetical protein